MSLQNGYSSDYNYSTINAIGRYKIYKSSGVVEGLLPISKLTLIDRSITARENTASINYGTPFSELAEGKDHFTVKANVLMVGLANNIDLKSFVNNSMEKTISVVKPYATALGSRRTRSGYMIDYNGTLQLILITEDNVMMIFSSKYLSDAQLVNFANSFKAY
jgi:hypothetical protein